MRPTSAPRGQTRPRAHTRRKRDTVILWVACHPADQQPLAQGHGRFLKNIFASHHNPGQERQPLPQPPQLNVKISQSRLRPPS